ncbi:unnamed protein product [Thlaspi arvense]|uniref:Uncharacterized protein n=1 Tax=Thlaspi arvense TaxID=13288 RepID=A0AAU9SSI0_THLAR|nr:unnamed protein product [Thlaspi arvense]
MVNAKITKKGTSKSNVAIGKTVKTLVVTSSNIVQIVAEGVSVPTNVAGNVDGKNVVSAVGDSPSESRSCIANKSIKSGIERRGTNHRRNSAKLENHLENKVKSGKDQEPRSLLSSCTKDAMKDQGRRKKIGIAQNKQHPSLLNHQRQAGSRILKCGSEQSTDVHQEGNVDAQSTIGNSTSERVKPIEQEKNKPELPSNGFLETAERPLSPEFASALDENSEMSQGFVVSTNKLLPTQAATDPMKKTKDFKLNPGARIFSPSVTKRISSTPAGTTPVVANMGYVPLPSNTPMLPVPEALQPEIGMNLFLPHASSKFFPYTNLTNGVTGVGSHFPQHMVEPTINRAQPHRFTSQFHSVQATPPNLVMVGRSGQLMYVQPISQGAPHHSHLPARPLFAPQEQFQYPKHQHLIATGQAPMQIYPPQPFAASGHQPYAVMPTNIPVMQPPFPTNQPMPLPVPNGFFGTKFL